MKLHLTILTCLILFLDLSSQSNYDLFISEYVEGSGNNKAIEIYNPTNEIVVLDKYYVARYSNGGLDYTSGGITQLVGFLQPYSTHLIVNGQTTTSGTSPACDPALQAMAQQLDHGYPAPTYMNGNDAIALFFDPVGSGSVTDFVVVDLFGIIGGGMQSSDVGWANFTNQYAYKNIYNGDVIIGQDSVYIQNYIVPETYYWLPWSANHSLFRKPNVNYGVKTNPATEFIITAEWDTLPGGADVWENLGKHKWLNDSCGLGTINIDYTTLSPSCFGGSDGAIELNVDGTNPPFTYSWSTGDTTQNLESLSAGEYLLQVSDTLGCSKSMSIQLNEPSPLSLMGVGIEPTCFGYDDGSIEIMLIGGTAPYSCQWSTGDTTDDISDLTAGWYKVTVTDTLECTLYDSIEILEPAPLNLTIIDIVSPTYYGFSNGQAKVEAEGGKAPYYYLWDNSYGSTYPAALDLSPNIFYHVTVTDNNGCTKTDSIFLSGSKVLYTMPTVLEEITCRGYSDGSAFIFIPIGEPPYSYLWDHDSTLNDSIATSLQAGITYHVSVIDAIGNTGEGFIVLTEPPPPNFSIALTVDKQLLTAPPFAFQFNNYTPNMLDYIFIWDFGDDTTIINNNPTLFHEYDYNGTYDVTLQAKHQETGCIDSLFLKEYIYCTGGEDSPLGIRDLAQNYEVVIYPNPFNQSTTITFPNSAQEPYMMVVTDLSGKIFRIVDDITTSEYVLEKGDLKAGLYFIELRGPKIYRGKIVIE